MLHALCPLRFALCRSEAVQNKTLTAVAFVVALVTAWLAQQLVRHLFGYGPGLISTLTLLGGFCGGLAAFVAFFRWRRGTPMWPWI